MIPSEKREAVECGLREAFGVSEFDEISQITRGQTSSLVCRMVVGGSAYLLKMILREEDPSRHFESMKAAAAAGIAPRVYYASVEDRIFISDFVADDGPPDRSDALVRLPALLRRLHALPPFGRAPFNTTFTFLLRKGPALDGFLGRFKSEELLLHHAELAAACWQDEADMVSSHNDLFKPDNMLFDGERVLLVDWEAAFLNDRYADLAVVANQLVTNDVEEAAFLREYFRAEPDEYQLARLHLMRQLAHLFYTMAFLGLLRPDLTGPESVPDYDAYHQRFWTGEVDLTNNDLKMVYGRIHWERLRWNARQPRYREALRIMSDRQKTVYI